MAGSKAAKSKRSTTKARRSPKSKQRTADGGVKSEASSKTKREASSKTKRDSKASASPSKSKDSSSKASRKSTSPALSKASPSSTSKAKAAALASKATSSAIALAQPNADNSAKPRKSMKKKTKKQSGNDGYTTPSAKGKSSDKKTPPTASTVASEASAKSLVRRSLKNSLNLEGKRVVDGSKKIKKTSTNVVKLQSHQIDWHLEGGKSGVDHACKVLVEGLDDLSAEEIHDMAHEKKVDILLDIFTPKELSFGFIPFAMKIGVDLSTLDMSSAFASKSSSKSMYEEALQKWKSKKIEVVDSDESTSDKKT